MSHSEMHEDRENGIMAKVDFCFCETRLTRLANMMTTEFLNVGCNEGVIGLLGTAGHNIEAFSQLVCYYLGEEAFEESY